MEMLREFTATLIFIVGVTLVVSLIGVFDWGDLIAAIGCFVAAYFIWPSKRHGYREQDNRFLDMLEIIIELPIDILVWIVRFVIRIFRSNDGGIDIDL